MVTLNLQFVIGQINITQKKLWKIEIVEIRLCVKSLKIFVIIDHK